MTVLNILVARFDDWSVDRKLSTQHFANGLSALGHNVKFLAKPGNILAGRLNRNISFFLLPKRIKIYDFLPSIIFTKVFVSKNIRETNWDIVVIGTIAAYPILNQLSYSKLVYHMHDDFFKYNLTKFERNTLNKIIAESDVVMCSSQKIMENLKTKNSWYVGQNLSDTFVKTLASVKSISKERKGIVYIGSVTNILKKDWKYLNRNVEISLTVIGDYPEEHKESFKNINWLGKKPHIEALTYLCSAKYGLFWLDTSKLETDYAATNPMKYVEYYASGLQIVSLDLSLNHEELDYLNNGQLSLFSCLADLISYVNSDKGMSPYPVALDNLLWTEKSAELLKLLV